LPALAVIPQVGAGEPGAPWKKLPPEQRTAQLRLITFQKPRSQAAESYRSLRTSLLLQGASEPPKVVAVTSSLPLEGKTLTAVNCAAVLAQQGARVLLVDADLRRPSLHKAFGIPQDPGLSDILAGACTESAATVTAEAISNLSLLASGAPPEFPAEMLASEKMLELMQRWRLQYDHVILDTPPVAMFTDAVVLGAQADAVLLVARASTTTRQMLRHTRDTLQRANLHIAGVVLNGADLRHHNGYYRAYRAAARKVGTYITPIV